MGILSSKLSGITNNLTNTGGTLNNQFLSSQLFQLDGELGGVKLVGFGVPGIQLRKHIYIYLFMSHVTCLFKFIYACMYFPHLLR